MPSVRGNPAEAAFSLLSKGKIPKQTSATGARPKCIFQRPVPLGWSQLQREAYLFNQSHSCPSESSALGEGPETSISKSRWSPPHQQTLPAEIISHSVAQNPESRGSAVKADRDTHTSRIDRDVPSPSCTETGQDEKWNRGLGLGKVSQAIWYLTWARDNGTVFGKLIRFGSTEFWLIPEKDLNNRFI